MKKFVQNLKETLAKKQILSTVKSFAKKYAPFLAIAGFASVPHMANAAAAAAQDMFQSQHSTVTASFGSGSTVEKWFYIAEVFMGLFSYIKTRSPIVFFGIALVVIFTKVAFSIIG